MARIKSLLIGAQLDQAKHSHNCQANDVHRIQAGDARLKVRSGRSAGLLLFGLREEDDRAWNS